MALGSLWLSLRHARSLAEQQRESDRERLLFEAQERRYDDRRDAAIALDAAAAKVLRDAEDFEEKHQVHISDLSDALDLVDLDEALARVVMLSTPEVTAAATDLYRATMVVVTGRPKDSYYEFIERAQPAFRDAASGMLAAGAIEPRSIELTQRRPGATLPADVTPSR